MASLSRRTANLRYFNKRRKLANGLGLCYICMKSSVNTTAKCQNCRDKINVRNKKNRVTWKLLEVQKVGN